jgi:hypothetical protein
MFKKLFFLQCLVYSSCVLGTGKPYDFLAKHPLVSRTFKALTAGLGAAAITYSIGNYFQDNHSVAHSLFAGAAVGAGVWIYDTFVNVSKNNVDKKQDLLDTILCDPKKALLDSTTVRNQMESEAESKSFNTFTNAQVAGQYKSLVKKYEAQSPLLLLSECTGDDSSPCIQSRIGNPKIRETYEERMAEALLKKSKEQNLTTYVSFGDGKFQDLVILTKFLAKNPTAKLAVHLIDDTHTPYIAYLDLGKKSREITAQELKYEDLMATMPQLIAKAKNEWGSKQKDDVISSFILNHIIPVDLEYKEFLNWLRTQFPKATITLFIHESEQSYIKAIEKYKFEYPDILSAAEIHHDVNKFNNSLPNYINLCIKMLSKKPNSINMLLTKSLGNQNKPCIITCSLKPSENARSSIMEENGKKTTVYLTENKI